MRPLGIPPGSVRAILALVVFVPIMASGTWGYIQQVEHDPMNAKLPGELLLMFALVGHWYYESRKNGMHPLSPPPPSEEEPKPST